MVAGVAYGRSSARVVDVNVARELTRVGADVVQARYASIFSRKLVLSSFSPWTGKKV
jgi:hypothetical protein